MRQYGYGKSTCVGLRRLGKKLIGMHTNGDVEETMTKAKAAQEEYQTFLETFAAYQMTEQ